MGLTLGQGEKCALTPRRPPALSLPAQATTEAGLVLVHHCIGRSLGLLVLPILTAGVGRKHKIGEGDLEKRGEQEESQQMQRLFP